MSDTKIPYEWINRAEEDYSMVRSALRHKIPLVYPACFHAQQCAEKYLKSMLIANNLDFPKTHDLLMLATICEEANITLPVDTKELNNLNDYSVRVRYPGENPSLEDAKDAFRTERIVRKFVRDFFGLG